MNRDKKYLIASAGVLLLVACGFSNQTPSESSQTAITNKVASFQDVDENGNLFVSQVTEEIRGGERILRVRVSSNGKTVESTHKLTGSSFSVEIPLSGKFRDEMQANFSGENQALANAEIGAERERALELRQNLESANRFMLKADYGGAMREVDAALLIDGRNARALTMKGSIFYVQGHVEKAAEQYEKALQIEPDNKEIQDFLNFIRDKESPKPENAISTNR